MFGTEKKRLQDNLDGVMKKLATTEDNFKLYKEEQERKQKITKEDTDREIARLRDAETILKKKFEDDKAIAYKTMELEFKGKMQDEVQKVREEADKKLQKGLEENFSQLKDQLAKLHSEGNAQTKFTEKIALNMMSVLKPEVKNVTPTAIEG